MKGADPWYPGESVNSFVFTEQGGKTLPTMTMTYDSKKARDGVLESPMKSGMDESDEGLDRVLKEELKASRQR